MPQVVKDIMSSPPVTIGMDTTMAQVKEVFDRRRFHHLIVQDDQGKCAGVLSDRDLLHTVSPFIGKLAERSADVESLKKRAHQVMSRKLIAVREQTLLRAAARVMLDYNISCLPVVDHELRCVGIITIRDIVRWSIAQMSAEIDQALSQPGGTSAPRRAA
jgi:acetoin utilization protein AcuB